MSSGRGRNRKRLGPFYLIASRRSSASFENKTRLSAHPNCLSSVLNYFFNSIRMTCIILINPIVVWSLKFGLKSQFIPACSQQVGFHRLPTVLDKVIHDVKWRQTLKIKVEDTRVKRNEVLWIQKSVRFSEQKLIFQTQCTSLPTLNTIRKVLFGLWIGISSINPVSQSIY